MDQYSMPVSLESTTTPSPTPLVFNWHNGNDTQLGDVSDHADRPSPVPEDASDHADLSSPVPDDALLEPPPSPILQALLSQDILAEIFSHFGINLQKPSETELHSREALRCASLTCKTWSTPALDALWSALSSWIPLLKLLPNIRCLDGKYVFSGYFAKDEIWGNFKTYASRVKSLCVGSDDEGSQISSHIFVRLAKLQNPDYPLLPALTRLHFPNCTAPSPEWEGVFLALSPNLRSVSMEKMEPSTNDFVASIISACLYDSPNIRYLTFDGDLTVEACQDITKFQQLRVLKMKTFIPADFTFLRNLGDFPNLVDLTIRMPIDMSFQIWATHFKCFKALRVLHIIGSAISVQKLLKCVSPSTLRDLTLTATSGDTQGNWKDCFDLVAEFTSLKSLCVLIAEVSEERFKLTYHQLSSIFCSTRILNKIIISAGVFEASDEDICNMVYSLPELRILRLPAPPISQAPTSLPTFQSLRTLSLLCPRLESLAISVQSSKIPTSIPTLHMHTLRDLTVNARESSWSMNQMISMSHFTYAAFPNASIENGKTVLIAHSVDSLWGGRTAAKSSEFRGLFSAYQSIHTSLVAPESDALAIEISELLSRKLEPCMASPAPSTSWGTWGMTGKTELLKPRMSSPVPSTSRGTFCMTGNSELPQGPRTPSPSTSRGSWGIGYGGKKPKRGRR